jgi:hypothetical protein
MRLLGETVSSSERVEELISRQMGQAQLQQQAASRRDSLEIQEKIDDVVTALTHRFDGRGSPPFNSTFQTVARDIQEVRLCTNRTPSSLQYL